MADERKANGKSQVAKISLKAYHKAGMFSLRSVTTVGGSIKNLFSKKRSKGVIVNLVTS